MKLPEVIFFTGFPGFIGARLLPRLLELKPEATIRCLVQERFIGMAKESIALIEKERPAARGRITTVVGDITSPWLGLLAAEARSLGSEITSAYHLAAVYDLTVPRDVGERINVQGTKNVVDFLGEAPHLTSLHYVSTAYVSGTATGVFRETDLDLGQGFKNYYEETKFKAEVEVVKSKIPATIYRPAIVVGDSRTGETAKFDGPYFTLAAMERIPSPGIFIRVGSGQNPINLVPVDFILESLAQLSSLPASAGKTYHLTDPAPLSVFEVEKIFAQALGKSFVYLPLPRSITKALFSWQVVQRFWGMPVQIFDYFDHPCRYDTTEATKALQSLGMACPSFSSYAQRLVDFYKRKRSEIRRQAMI